MTRRIVTGALVGALAIAFSTGVAAQANPQNSAYVLSAQMPPDNNIWRNGTSERLCWRTGYWTPAQAIVECDPDLVPKPAAPPPPAAAPASIVPAEPPAPGSMPTS